MKTMEIKLARIGNSRGVRLPANLIRRHHLDNGILLEERESEIVLRPKKAPQKLSWEETAREMAAANEDWSEWDGALGDGLDACPWDHPLPPEARTWARQATVRTKRNKSVAKR